MKDIQDCMRGLKRLIEIDAQNKEARGLTKKAKVAQKEDDRRSKGLFTNMCKALGKGPLPEPYKDKKSCSDDGMSDNDEPLPMSAQEDGTGEIPPVKTDGNEKVNDSNSGDGLEGKSKVGGDGRVDDSSPGNELEGANK